MVDKTCKVTSEEKEDIYCSPINLKPSKVMIIRKHIMESFLVCVYAGPLILEPEYVAVEAHKNTLAVDIVQVAVRKLKLRMSSAMFELAEVFSTGGQLCKERRFDDVEYPVSIQLLWPKDVNTDDECSAGLFTGYRFYLRKRDPDVSRSNWVASKDQSIVDTFLMSFLQQPVGNKEYDNMCNLPELNEQTLLQCLKQRFNNSKIYTYIGSILIAVNPFRFFPIYNPKYVKMYQNKQLGELPPHIFAVADFAYYTMLRTGHNQCIVISGESGSGKTESTNLLLHHLTALSHKGFHGSGVEQTLLGAGPVLEAFGNAKTVHNNNSSRFGKYIQVNYKKNGMVHGAILEKYLLEKSRIVSQARNERSYHVFYYLLAGAEEHLKEVLHLSRPENYRYLSQSHCYSLEGVDEEHEYQRLMQSMEMVGFSHETQRKIFSVLSSVLHLGNVEFKKKGDQHHDESVVVSNEETVQLIADLLKVKQRTVVDALTQKTSTAGDETFTVNYRMEDAVASRDAMGKCIYGSLFDWIVLKVNQSLLTKKHDSEHEGNSIGVLDIFGFEDFGNNSFEQFCINNANEHLHYYFNQHIFKFEQEEYQQEGIKWENIEYIDNTGCLETFSKRPSGLIFLLDDECNFPGASNSTLLSKFSHNHRDNPYFQVPQLKEEAFIITHYAGKVKYMIKDFREKNCDLVRPEIFSLLKRSSMAFVRELVGIDPVAMLRWTVLRTLFRCLFAFTRAGHMFRKRGVEKSRNTVAAHLHLSNGTLNERLFRPSKFIKPHRKSFLSFHDIKTLKAITSRTLCGAVGAIRTLSKKQPPSVSAQFQWSLARLMCNLNQANPFFIRCIKSNSDKAPCHFDDSIVQRQLRYTGMLATVKIRQSGFNYRLSVEEFIRLYKILLPRGLLSAREDVRKFLISININMDSCQIGATKIFLRESEKLVLDDSLHFAIMKRVVSVQRWVKSQLQRISYCRLRKATIVLQKHTRRFLAQRLLSKLQEEFEAACCLQRAFRARRVRSAYLAYRDEVIFIQTYIRGAADRHRFVSARKEMQVLVEKQIAYEREKLEELRRQKEQDRACIAQEEMRSTTSDEGVIMLKTNSAEGLDDREIAAPFHLNDSEESSGILDDSDTEPVAQYEMAEALLPSAVYEASRPLHEDDSGDLGGARVGFRKVYLFKTAKDTSSTNRHLSSNVPTPQEPAHHRVQEESPSKYSDPQTINQVDRPSVLSSDHLTETTEAVTKGRPSTINIVTAADEFSGSQESQTHLSPFFTKAKKHIKSIMGAGTRRKKDDSDDDDGSHLSTSALSSPVRCPDECVCMLPSNAKPTSILHQDLRKGLGSVQEHIRPFPVTETSKDIKKRRVNHAVSRRSQKPKSTQSRSNVNFYGTSEWQYSDDLKIAELPNLMALDEFISRKCHELFKGNKSRTTFDNLFRGAVNDFSRELKTVIAVEMQHQDVSVKYRDLFDKFRHLLVAKMKRENADVPLVMALNAFRGFLDEFMKQCSIRRREKGEDRRVEKPVKQAKHKKNTAVHLGHKFIQVQFSIHTFCECCGSLIWIMDKGQVCQVCKYTCHKKCSHKLNLPCRGSGGSAYQNRVNSGKVFGSPLENHIKDGSRIPLLIEKLFASIEVNGLFTEGLYRKSGAASVRRELRILIEADLHTVVFDDYPMHVLTTMVKSFLRELPEPLLTFELFEDFLRGTEFSDRNLRMQFFFTLINRLPKPNYDLFERLMFHLTKIVMHNDANRMTVQGLAIIFAPCLLWSGRNIQAQEALSYVPMQTSCIEEILSEELENVRSRLADINSLEFSVKTAEKRLDVIRCCLRESQLKGDLTADALSGDHVQEHVQGTIPTQKPLLAAEEVALSAQIASMHMKRSDLTSQLSILETRQPSSDEDFFSEDIGGTVDKGNTYACDRQNSECSDNVLNPEYTPFLQHVTKNRAPVPKDRRPPLRYGHQRITGHAASDIYDTVADSFYSTPDAQYAPTADSGAPWLDRHASPYSLAGPVSPPPFTSLNRLDTVPDGDDDGILV